MSRNEDKTNSLLTSSLAGEIIFFREKWGMVPNVCILDVNMPVMNGFATAKALRSKYPDLKILAYSMNNDEKNIIGMVQSGARGYISKGTDPSELKRAIEVLHKGGCYLDTESTKTILSYLGKRPKN